MLSADNSNSLKNALGASLVILTQVLATLCVAYFGTLHDAGEFTLAFSLFAPLNLASGLGFSQMMIANTPGYTSPSNLILARLYIAVPLNLLAIVAIAALGSRDLLMISAMVSASRLFDLSSDILQSYYRRQGKYGSIVVSGIVSITTFATLFIVAFYYFQARALLATGLAFLSSSILIFTHDWICAKTSAWRYTFSRSHVRAIKTLRGNWRRGISNFINSMCANIPRYFLYVFVSPSAQAVYSLLVALARLGMLGIHSFLLPRLEKLKNSLSEITGVRATFRLSGVVSLLFSTILFIGWIVALNLGLVDKFNKEILIACSAATSSFVVASSFFVFLRFCTWTVAMVSVSQANQVVISTVSAALIFATGWPLTYYFGVFGACISEIIGGLFIITSVYYVLKTRGTATEVRGRSDVRVGSTVVTKLSRQPSDMAEKYNAVHEALSPYGYMAPRAIEWDSRSVKIEKLLLSKTLKDVYLSFHNEEISAESACLIIRSAGNALARIHLGVTERGKQWAQPCLFSHLLKKKLGRSINIDRLPQAVLHGDYTYTNVCLNGGYTDWTICVIDPCPNGGSTFEHFQRGPIYVDIGLFVACLHGQVALSDRANLKAGRNDILIAAFLEGYSETSGIPLYKELAIAFGYAGVGCQFDYRYGILGYLRLAVLFPYNRQRSRATPA